MAQSSVALPVAAARAEEAQCHWHTVTVAVTARGQCAASGTVAGAWAPQSKGGPALHCQCPSVSVTSSGLLLGSTITVTGMPEWQLAGLSASDSFGA